MHICRSLTLMVMPWLTQWLLLVKIWTMVGSGNVTMASTVLSSLIIRTVRFNTGVKPDVLRYN